MCAFFVLTSFFEHDSKRYLLFSTLRSASGLVPPLDCYKTASALHGFTPTPKWLLSAKDSTCFLRKITSLKMNNGWTTSIIPGVLVLEACGAS